MNIFTSLIKRSVHFFFFGSIDGGDYLHNRLALITLLRWLPSVGHVEVNLPMEVGL